MGLVHQFVIHVQGITAGDRLRDRVAIAILVGLRTLAPLWSILDRVNIRPPSPLGLIGHYRIRAGSNRWEIEGSEGAAYLFPRTVLGNAYVAFEHEITEAPVLMWAPASAGTQCVGPSSWKAMDGSFQSNRRKSIFERLSVTLA